MYPLLALTCTVLVYALFQFVTSRLSKQRLLAEARRLGCKPPHLRPNRLPFGIDHVREAIKADSEKRFPDLLVERASDAFTYQYNFIGNEQLHTDEPKNIQAMLATQFSDFSLGELRRGIMFPLLGNGIFTQDGKAW